MTLTISAKPETILGVMRKLNICNAKFSVNKGYSVVLDECEAALDEANVDMFGDYLSTMKETSQFILITHKKRMMEYADTLYGITMEESGVSKLVSVKLEDK